MKIQKRISKRYNYSFKVSRTGLVAIFISARCRSRKQIKSNIDEDLRVEINGSQFRETPPLKYKQMFNIPPAFNGSKLKGLKKTVVFLAVLSKGKNIISLAPKNSAFVEEIEIKRLAGLQNIMLKIEEQAEDGDRRPWYSFSLINLALKELSIDASVFRRFRDSDDIKVIVNGKVQTDIQTKERTIKWRFWLWIAELIEVLKNKEYRDVKNLSLSLSRGVHYLQIIADRMPILHNVKLDFGEIPKRVPARDDPKWTGDFESDSEEMLLARLIFGEAEGEPQEAKIWVAWSVINRVKKKAWPGTIHDVILQKGQYDPFKSSDRNYSKIINPLSFEGSDELSRKSWHKSYEIAVDIISGKIENPTTATHFHGRGVARDWFERQVVPSGKFLKKIGATYFYWSPN